MVELFHTAFSPPNLMYTVFLCLVLLYWITVFAGALDMEFLDFDVDNDFEVNLDLDIDVDVDVDVDVDTDVDADTDADTSSGNGGSGWFLNTLAFFNLGSVPFMVFLSFLVLSAWSFSMVANDRWGVGNEWFPLIILIPNLILSLFVTKVFTTPFKGIYKKMNKQTVTKKELVGKTCKVTLAASENKAGQAELHFDGKNFLLKVYTTKGKNIAKGNQAIIVEYDRENDHYVIEPFDI